MATGSPERAVSWILSGQLTIRLLRCVFDVQEAILVFVFFVQIVDGSAGGDHDVVSRQEVHRLVGVQLQATSYITDDVDHLSIFRDQILPFVDHRQQHFTG